MIILPSFPDSDTTNKNEPLSSLMDTLFHLIKSPDCKAHVTKLTAYPLTLVLLGKRCSGKRSLAKKLAEYCSLKVVEVGEVIQSAVR